MDDTPQTYYWRNREAILAKARARYAAMTPEQREAQRIKNAEKQRRLRAKAKTAHVSGPVVFHVSAQSGSDTTE